MPDLLERDLPRRGHWVLRIAISPIILKLVAQQINGLPFLFF
jgi:hypothetical protein